MDAVMLRRPVKSQEDGGERYWRKVGDQSLADLGVGPEDHVLVCMNGGETDGRLRLVAIRDRGELLIRRPYRCRLGGREVVVLQAANPAIAPEVYEPDQVAIYGTVEGIARPVR